MNRAPESGEVRADGIPRLELAARHERLLKIVLAVCLSLVGCLSVVLGFGWFPTLKPVWVIQTAALLVLSASVQSVWWVTRWRSKALNSASLTNVDGVDTVDLGSQTARNQPNVDGVDTVDLGSQTARNQQTQSKEKRTFTLFSRAWRRSAAVCRALSSFIKPDTSNHLLRILLSSAAVALIAYFWTPQPSLDAAQLALPIKLSVLIGLVILLFAALVLERHFANAVDNSHSASSLSALPEAVHIAYQLRVYITLGTLSIASLLLAEDGRRWPAIGVMWIGNIPAVIALEFLLRTLFAFFAPPQQGEPALLAESLLASLWRWPIKPFAHFHDELTQRFGIDLRQSWAFAYIRRRLILVVSTLVGVAWITSGVNQIALDERGIYEQFGAPVSVWQPGIHVGLPWPMGRVQRLENGLIHELSATASEVPTKARTQTGTPDAEQMPSAEGPPPATANRLWDASHLAEKSQIIASEVTTSEGNRQSFHIVNMDVRFMYRIGLTDSDALKARYTSADTQALIRSAANRILVRYFASRTLEGVLGEARAPMSREIGVQLQNELNGFNSGVEIMSTVLEAIHPPAAAANAYHAVQAAHIQADAIIARERGNAAQQINLAQLRGGIVRYQASATARETVTNAEVAQRHFLAERDAYQQGGKAFLLEHYFARLTEGLANARVLLVDHRLPSAGLTLDLRAIAGSVSDKSAKAAVAPVLSPSVDYVESP